MWTKSLYIETNKHTKTGLKIMTNQAKLKNKRLSITKIGITPLNRLRVVITGPGIYMMRNGSRARVHTANNNSDKTVTAFTCKGCVETMYRGRLVYKAYKIWHESGLATTTLSECDIVARLS